MSLVLLCYKQYKIYLQENTIIQNICLRLTAVMWFPRGPSVKWYNFIWHSKNIKPDIKFLQANSLRHLPGQGANLLTAILKWQNNVIAIMLQTIQWVNYVNLSIYVLLVDACGFVHIALKIF